MKAVNYQGAFKVKVEDVPMPKIEHPDDVVVKVTTAGELAEQLLYWRNPEYVADWVFVFQFSHLWFGPSYGASTLTQPSRVEGD